MRKLFLAAALVALLALPSGAAGDAVYHSQHLVLHPVGAAPLHSAFVENIHVNGPNIYAHEDEVRGAALQYVRKISGFSKPSLANEEAFARAVDEVAEASARLLDALVTNAPPRDREVEAERKRARAAERFSLAR